MHDCRIDLRSLCVVVTAFAVGAGMAGAQDAPIAIGSRLEPMVDDYLIEAMAGVGLALHTPVAREVAITYDAPWEGNTSCYVTVFQDGDLYRMYFRGSDYNLETKQSSGQRTCYAESTDGIHWTKPELGLFEFEGSKANNIVWEGVGTHNFAPFKDLNPDCPPEARYKAVGSGEDHAKLVAFQSPDAIHWTVIREEPIITEGAFDSQNIAFWDAYRGRYVAFHRGFADGVRAIMTSFTNDFMNWPTPQWLDYGGTPPEHLYTNAITAYFRAPHIFLGFPKRFMPERDLKVHEHPGVSDGVFMTSRDGEHWRRWREAFIRPGLQQSRWVNRNNMTAWGVLQTHSAIPDAPDELSVYSTEGYYVGPCHLRRYTIRMDGFVSVHASAAGGEFTTKPLTFEDDPAVQGAGGPAETELVINYSTSAAGSIRCEILDAAGAPLPGYALADCDEVYGDYLERAVTWQGRSGLKELVGVPVRLRFVMSDADLFAIRFR
ncbi:MAG TPA: hypothetical protein PLO37_16125 [Candidatus Hydrogenedentes bacterium]|nr:hypothetical protein [Candidatus Hydrogenedentota bacterium]HPG68373.1 hypothetical protein [Candidatus Hydrogenedentota bacterium]